MNTHNRIKPLNLGLVLLWIVFTGIGWVAITGFGWAAIIVASACLLIISPLLAAIPGALQRRVLKLAGYEVEAGWTARTVLGWLAGLIALFIVLQVMSIVHHSQPIYSLFIVTGDQVEVATKVGGLALMGAVVGAFQWSAPLPVTRLTSR